MTAAEVLKITARLNARIEVVSHLLVRIQAVESCGLFAIAERLHTKLATAKQDVEEIKAQLADAGVPIN